MLKYTIKNFSEGSKINQVILAMLGKYLENIYLPIYFSECIFHASHR